MSNMKLGFAASAIAASALLFAGCGSNGVATAPSIDGGVMYPVENGKTSVYSVNEDAEKGGYSFGRTPTANEIAAWNHDVMPDGTGLPEGEGNADEGSEIYDEKCVSCHGDFGSGGGGYPSLSKGAAADITKTLTNQRVDGSDEGPKRVFGSYWPEASTLFWYIKDAMPHATPDSLTHDEVYSLVAYILNINEMSIDGVEVDDEYVLNREKFLKIKMVNKDGFVPVIDGKDGLKNVREFYKTPANFGGRTVAIDGRCMTDCQEPTAKIVHIKNGGINDFNPPMNTKRDKPVVVGEFDAKKAYTESCALCHAADGFGAPVLGDKAAWSEKTAKGMAAVYKNGIDGINGMPPKGGASLSDSEFKQIVDYIVNASK